MTNEYEFKLKTKENQIKLFNLISNICSHNFKLLAHENISSKIVNINSNSNAIKVLLYDDDIKLIKKFDLSYIKTRVQNEYVNDIYCYNDMDVDITLSHSIEKPVTNFNFNDINNKILYRLKIRDSYVLIDDWRIDLTIACQFNNPANGKYEKTVFNFFKDPAEHATSYEIEIEYTGTYHMDMKTLKEKMTQLLSVINIYENESKQLYRLISNNNTLNLNFHTIINSAVTLDKYMYYKPENKLYMFDNYLITDKLDGVRVLVFIYNSKINFVFSHKKVTERIDENNNVIILDGEFYNDSVFVFDALYCNGNITEETYIDRIKYFNICKKVTDFIECSHKIYYKTIDIIDNSSQDYSLKTLLHKHYIEKNKEDYILDGLIISEPNKSYSMTTNYKWKPVEDSSIDFYCVFTSSKMIDGEIKYIYHLYTKASLSYVNKLHYNNRNTIPISTTKYKVHLLFTHPYNNNDYIFIYKDDTLNEKVIELKKNLATWEWVLCKIRYDKKIANSTLTANQIYASYTNPLTLEMLYNTYDIHSHYFISSVYTEGMLVIKKYNNAVKFDLYNTYIKGSTTLLDLGAGRGTDINKYSLYKLQRVIMIDIDTMALHETVVDRLVNLSNNNTSKTITIPMLDILQLDLSSNYLDIYDAIVNRTKLKKVDNVLISMSLHYYGYSTELMNNMSKLLQLVLNSGGNVIITLLNKQKVIKLLSEHNNEWISDKGYHIKLIDESNIRIKLPFTNDDMYSEKLLNVASIIKIFKKANIINILSKSFIDFPFNKNDLDDDSKTYIELHHALVFSKIK